VPPAPAQLKNSPWLFGVLALPWGISYSGLVGLLVPYLLRKHGVSVDRIAEAVSVASLPLICSFLVAPIVDLGLPRRTWVLLAAAITGIAAWAAIVLSLGSLPLLTLVLFAATVANTLMNSANGGLMSEVRPEVRGRVGGFYQAGNLGGGALGGGGLIWLADRMSLPWLALLTALFIIGPALAALWIEEAPRPTQTLGTQFFALFCDVKDILKSSRTWVGLAFFLSPVGAGAVSNLISSVGPDYHATGTQVALVTGAGGGLLIALGSLIGGWICDRADRRTVYAVFGLLIALSGAWLCLGPSTPFTFTTGYSAYALTIGLFNSAYVALILEVLDARKRGASTGYAFFSSSGNVNNSYMTWLDGVGYRYAGARGLMATDAALGGVGGLILFAVARHFVRRQSSQDPQQLRA
jgi:MFS transporter, PAT family, beta-lactamase induction signal transducer AmpG